MNQDAPQRLYLMLVGSMPEYGIPVVCYIDFRYRALYNAAPVLHIHTKEIVYVAPA